MKFSGSYEPDDVTFLLKPVRLEPIDIEEKERLIQSGERHYSEMLSREAPPEPIYLALFHDALSRNRRRFAAHIACLARRLVDHVSTSEVVLVSLARAGTPIGVLLKRTLERLDRACVHYSISIIRDRGIDATALDYILARHAGESVVFLDGWTGKGVIAEELFKTVTHYNAARGAVLDPSLYVVSDLAGAAGFAAATDDYLIPSSILNAVISGLVSRTVLNATCVGPGEFHACVFYEEFAGHDLSRWFVGTLMDDIERALASPASAGSWRSDRRDALRQTAVAFVREAMRRYGVRDPNRIKPGIGEATRALLRRAPERLLVADQESDDLAHLLWLAGQRRVPVEQAEWLPYRAAAIIRSVGNER